MSQNNASVALNAVELGSAIIRGLLGNQISNTIGGNAVDNNLRDIMASKLNTHITNSKEARND